MNIFLNNELTDEEFQKLAFAYKFKENTMIRNIYEGWSGGLRGEELYKALMGQYYKGKGD